MTARPSLSVALPARVWRIVALAVTIAGALAIAGTYFTFSNTFDEPAHLAAGMQRLATGRYDYDAQRPPLGRIAAAVGPYLHGGRSVGASSAYDEGARLLGHGAHYRTTLALARLGELPFFLLLCGVLWAWARQLTDDRGGAIAVALAASNPNLLAHAGLATTDYASLAMLALAFPAVYLTRRHATGRAPIWSDNAGRRASLALGVVFAAAAITGWGVYGFHTGPLIEGSRVVVPAPEWFRGFASYVTAPSPARPAFLFGERSASGWWYYYLVALLVKSPLPLLLVAILGAAAAMRDLVRRVGWQLAAPLAATAAILLAAAFVGDDAGVRLVLPVFALLALLGTAAIVELWDHSATRVPARRLVRAVVAATLVAVAVVPMRAHPDYLAYFNPIAGDRPELILVDSNLDWGQDLYRLDMVMRRMRIDSVSVAYYGSASFDAAGVRHARSLAAAERPTGWIAASQTMLAGVGGDGAYEWLNELQPVGRVGASLVLYYVPPRRARR